MSVRQVWRETSALFWQYPVLWLPVLAADLLSFFLTTLQKYVTRRVVYHLLLGPASVFGETRSLPGPASNAPFGKASAVGGIFEWSMHFTQIVLYTIAFFITAALVRAISEQRTEFIQTSVQFVRSKWQAIFGLSLRVFGLVMLFALSFGTLMVSGIVQARKYMVHLPAGGTYAFGVAVFCCIAYFAAPTAMRRMSATALKPLNTDSKRAGRVFAMLMVFLASLLGYCLPYIERSLATEALFQDSVAITAMEVLVSLITAVPYAVLFIALTLLVERDTGIGTFAMDSLGLHGEVDTTISP